MFEPKPRRSGAAVSALYPLSATGLLLVVVVAGTLTLLRFTLYVFESDMAGLTSAGVVVFVLLAAAYMSRYLQVAAEASAEGYDLAPLPPNPAETELLFGALLRLMVATLFAFLPLGVAAAFGLFAGPVPIVMMILAAVYLPMALLAMAVTDDLGGCFPGTVLSCILTVPGRYLVNSFLAVAAGMFLVLGWTDMLSRLSFFGELGLDTGAAFFLSIVMHRMGVLHREEFVLRSVISFPTRDFTLEDIVTPRRPVSDIERIMEERENKRREGSRTP